MKIGVSAPAPYTNPIVKLLYAERNGGHRGKISVVDMVSPVSIGFFVYHRPGKVFSRPDVRADFREGDEDSNFSVFRVWRFTEWPGPLH